MKKVFALTTLLLVACGKQVENVVEVVKYDDSKGIDVLDIGIMGSIEIVPLETQDDILTGANPELLIANDGYFVIDKMEKKVLKFGTNGDFVKQIGRMGHGESEFSEINSVSLINGAPCIYSALNDAEYLYGKDGHFVKKSSVKYLARQIAHIEGKTLFYLGYKNQYGKARAIEVDGRGEAINKFLPSSANILTTMEDFPVFIPDGESIFVKETVNNDIYSIDGADAKIAFRFDYGKYNIPAEYYKMDDAYKAGDYLFSKEFATHPLFLINKSLVVLLSVIKKTDGITLAYAFKDKSSGKWTWCNYSMTDESDRDNIFAGSLKQLTDSDIYFMVEPHKLIKSNLRNSPLVSNPEVIDSLDENDNYVMLKCSLTHN